MKHEAWSGCVLRVLLMVTVAGLFGCVAITTPVPSQRGRDLVGSVVAQHLRERYDDLRADCRKDASDPHPLPSVLCSGILIRTVDRRPNFDVWNPNPYNPQPGGVSFSWLRRDHAMRQLAWGHGSGFIVLPHFYADDVNDGYTQLIVLCAFAVDGWTNDRRSPANDGCGETPGMAMTGPCQDNGITTYTRWLEVFGAGAAGPRQCGFRLTPGTPGAAELFDQLKHIRYRIPDVLYMNNEIRIGTWAQKDRHLPIEAFFYTNDEGRIEAFANQIDFLRFSGRWVPVIKITLPVEVWGNATFEYVR